MTSRGSARHPAVTKHHHIHSESNKWQAEDQPVIQQWQNTPTYILTGRIDKQRISQSSSSDKIQPHTSWEQEMTSRGSANHPAVTKHNHILAESKGWQAEAQPDIQQWQNTTTYILRARNDKQRISQSSSSDKTQPHTFWEQGMTSRGSARHPSVTKNNHIQAESKEWQAEDQPVIQQWQNTTTYKLRARNDKQRISQTSSSDKPQPHTNSEQGMTNTTSARHSPGINKCPYILKVKEASGILATSHVCIVLLHTTWGNRYHHCS